MKIRLFNRKNLWLTNDKFQWIVTGYEKDKKGQERFKDPCFFSRLSSAIHFACDTVLKDCETLAEIAKTIVDFKEWVESNLDYDALESTRVPPEQ